MGDFQGSETILYNRILYITMDTEHYVFVKTQANVQNRVSPNGNYELWLTIIDQY